MANTKVAYLITKLELGGAQKSALYSTQNLPQNFDAYLLCGRGGFFDADAKKNIKNLIFIDNLLRPISPLKDLSAFWQIVKKLHDIKPDIVHTHSSKAGILGRLAAVLLNKKMGAKSQKIKIAHTVHGFAFYDGQNPLKRRFYIFLERLLAKYTDALIFVSKCDMQQALRLKIGQTQKHHLIRAGIEIVTRESFSPQDKEAKLKELGLEPDAQIILCGANLKPQKNPLDTVRAAKIVCQKNPKSVFLYLGEGELKAKTLELVKELNLQKNFILTGRRQDCSCLLYCARVYALSSLWEGLPMAVVEALAMQTPCACYNVGGISEVIKDGQNGYLAPRGDYESLAQAILDILDGKLAFNAQAVGLEEFDIKNMLKRQTELYGRLTQK